MWRGTLAGTYGAPKCGVAQTNRGTETIGMTVAFISPIQIGDGSYRGEAPPGTWHVIPAQWDAISAEWEWCSYELSDTAHTFKKVTVPKARVVTATIFCEWWWL